MINFHKYGFLDCRKLKKYLDDSNMFLSEYNPYYLFVWASYYKFEIAYTNEYCFIRYKLPKLGVVYYPPIGKGDLAYAIEKMREDAKEHDYDFNFGPVLEANINKYRKFDLKLYLNDNLGTYIYSCLGVIELIKKDKAIRKRIKQYEIAHRNFYIKKIVKDDFAYLLEFITYYRESAGIGNGDLDFYPKLNMLKECMEHLYEFDFLGLLLRDEERIYGFAIGSTMDNCTYCHIALALENEIGAYDELMHYFARYASTRSTYMALEADLGNAKTKEKAELLKPQRKEGYYGNFNI